MLCRNWRLAAPSRHFALLPAEQALQLHQHVPFPQILVAFTALFSSSLAHLALLPAAAL